MVVLLPSESIPVSNPTPFLERHIQREQGSGNQDKILFFGDENWKSCEKDIKNIDEDVRADFIVHLFIATLMDQYIFSDLRSLYAHWRSSHPKYRKFGHSGTGPHNQHPFLIFTRSIETGILHVEDLQQRLDQAITLLNNYIEELPEDERRKCKLGLLQVIERDAGAQFRAANNLIDFLVNKLHREWD